MPCNSKAIILENRLKVLQKSRIFLNPILDIPFSIDSNDSPNLRCAKETLMKFLVINE
jgi:hypothetical protein